MGFFIPKTMINKRNWVVWRKEWFRGRWNKQPYSLVDGKKGGHTSPDKWVDYETAVLALEYEVEKNYQGLGFCMLESDRLTFIDIDHCVNEDGELTELAEEVLKMFPNTYTELSPSETGLHIICKGLAPADFNNQEKGIEMYSRLRYACITGNALNFEEPADHQESINKLFAMYSNKAEAAQKPHKSILRADNMQADEVVETIIKSPQGAKFKLLHYGGWEKLGLETKVDGSPDTSRADLAYFNMVVDITGDNDELAKQVFYQSVLSERPKAQRIDYIERTIKRAKQKSKHEVVDMPERKSCIMF